MVIRLNYEDGSTREVRALLSRKHGTQVLEDDAGTIYGSGDWYRLKAKVIFAAPHERERMPRWMRIE